MRRAAFAICLAFVALALPLAGRAAPRQVVTRLLYTGQDSARADYVVTGFPACAPPFTEIVYQAGDGSWHAVGDATADGSFRVEVAFESVGQFFSVVARDSLGRESPPALLRTDHPLTGGMWLAPNGRGWVNITTASVDLVLHRSQWLERYDPSRRRARAEGPLG